MSGMSDWSSVRNAKPDCNRCNGTGIYLTTTIGTTHYAPCPLCCLHDEGWWLLKECYGKNNGKWCCFAGCGEVRDSSEGLIIVE